MVSETARTLAEPPRYRQLGEFYLELRVVPVKVWRDGMISVATRVTRKGQVTIPAEFRRDLGISEGGRVEWERDGNRLILKRAESAVRRTAGIARKYSRGPAPTIQELKEAAHRAIVEDVVAELNQ